MIILFIYYISYKYKHYFILINLTIKFTLKLMLYEINLDILIK
jgi:hypothetical protein